MALKKSQKSLKKWTKQEWGTKSGKPSTQGKKATGERYLPKKAREALSDKEYAATSRKKRADTKKGKQHSKQPKKIAKKTLDCISDIMRTPLLSLQLKKLVNLEKEYMLHVPKFQEY